RVLAYSSWSNFKQCLFSSGIRQRIVNSGIDATWLAHQIKNAGGLKPQQSKSVFTKILFAELGDGKATISNLGDVVLVCIESHMVALPVEPPTPRFIGHSWIFYGIFQADDDRGHENAISTLLGDSVQLADSPVIALDMFKHMTADKKIEAAGDEWHVHHVNLVVDVFHQQIGRQVLE